MAHKILVIEDEAPLRKIICDELTREGYTALEAADGEAGLGAALAEHPDLILLDIILPRMDGITMLMHLRRDDWGANVPVIALTNLSDALTIERAVENGVYDYLVKTDWKIGEVITKVKEKLRD